jgi:hypothetical protein
VPAPGQQRQAGPGLGLVLGLGQDPPSDRDHGVGGQDESVRPARRHDLGLGLGQAQGQQTRGLVLQRGFVDLGRLDGVRDQTDLGQEVQPARAGAGQDQGRDTG